MTDELRREDAEAAGGLAGVPDCFQRLWTPHRLAYIESDKPGEPAGEECPFCTAPGRDDADGLIVHRGRTCYVVLNLFPYNPGHLLVCPYRHVSGYLDLTPAETDEFTTLTKDAVRALQSSSRPQGFNIGMNQGQVAGAGIVGHLHQHIVPRWGGDMNFFPIIAQTKAVPKLLDDVRQELVAAWPYG